MESVTVSPKYQVVIPGPIRKAMDITPGQKMQVLQIGNRIEFVPVRDVKLSAGPGFVVAYTGDITTMPGLPKVPAAEAMDIDANGETVGLF